MTANLTDAVATNGQDDAPMPTALSPEAFASVARMTVEFNNREDAHRLMDRLVMRQLTSLGFGEGVQIFERAVAGMHQA